MRGKVSYLGNIISTEALQLTYVKPFDLPTGKGYQRPVDLKRCKDFSFYLSNGADSLFTPILLNAEGNWEFASYDKQRPAFGRLLCKAKASLMDGQHRLGGIKLYVDETNTEINVPFLAFHYLDEDEEIKLFDTINTKAKGIGVSLSKYLRRTTDDTSWIATELITRRESPFYSIASITGKRSNGKHVTLQNLYTLIDLMFKTKSEATKEEKLYMILTYFSVVKEQFSDDWSSYKDSRLTHIVCLNALGISGMHLLSQCYSSENPKQLDITKLIKLVRKLKKFDWSSNGQLKYIKGKSGSKALANDIISVNI
ncbi:DGQHR domain-containing protein [Paenibacillus sacheonensis]|uniref:DGQHR domain-containing protein n=2 Tax=Paenibacillus sacheonensis TaxID=742054 RepID=A0A7X4YSH2_9BACL|nr:DGQHR domain-containing protein [Paenibacillus sacheonensis]